MRKGSKNQGGDVTYEVSKIKGYTHNYLFLSVTFLLSHKHAQN